MHAGTPSPVLLASALLSALAGSAASCSAPTTSGPSAPSTATEPTAPTALAACTQPEVAASCRDGMCLVPAGCFVMGAPREATSAASRNDQQVEVSLTHAFLIGQAEVTRREWLALGQPEPRVDWRVTGSSAPDVPPDGYGACSAADCPVLWLTFEDAASYANLRSEREGLRPCYVLEGCAGKPGDALRCKSVRVNADSPYACEGYRLPTEAEWEYAARAGTRGDYYDGAMQSEGAAQDAADARCTLDPALDAIGWYCGNSGALLGGTGGHAQPVEQKRPNAFGLYDVSGNAYEWTNDLYDPRGYGEGRLVDPLSGINDPRVLTPEQHPVYDSPAAADGYPGYRVVRGGAFDLWPVLAASSRRMHLFAGSQNTGMRLVRSVGVDHDAHETDSE